jgi:hypothetical protein
MCLPLRWLLLLGLWGNLCLFSQTTSTDSVATKLYESVFSIHQAKQYSLRLDLLQLVQTIDSKVMRGTLTLTYEQKIRPAWSLIGEYRRPFLMMLSPTASVNPPREHMSISVGTRYYHQLARHLAEGTQANNFSSNYLGVYLGSDFTSPLINRQQRSDPFWYSDNLAISVLGGVQRMILRVGFFDLSFGVRLAYGYEGYSRFVFSTYLEEGWQIFPVGQVRMGLGL